MTGKTYASALDLIGRTPLVRLGKMTTDRDAAVFAKVEGSNPGGSVKDRIALSMVEEAEKSGRLKPGGTIVEPTSGNTGIGLGLVAAVKGYRLILTMPDTMSTERRATLAAYGAELILTPGQDGMRGSVSRAEELVAANPEYYMPQQFNNPANPEVHRKTTAREILSALGPGIDAFVAGVGTGGTITGVGEVLRAKNRDIRIIAVEPATSPVLSGGNPGPHRIQGIGAGFVPAVLNTQVYDEVMQVTDEEAEEATRELALKEGLLAGISSGAALFAAVKAAARLGRGKTVVVILPDRGERYLSTGLFGNRA
ncbi:MAG TPA: cysteine synthase A [Nitrospirota bacterium]|nr:cysteine synthase A [Nitrospirota bacterium]